MGSFLFFNTIFRSENGIMYLNNIQKGYLGELIARDYLRSCGYRFLSGNWRCRYGEIDLICVEQKREMLVFVEVKLRISKQYGGAKQAITALKRKRLRSLVGLWWQENHEYYNLSFQGSRLDAVLIDWGKGKNKPDICHVKGI